MKLVINGDEIEIPDPATIARLVELRSPRPPFAVEVNKRHVRRPDYDKTDLQDGDRIEIVTLVGGG